MVNKICYWNSYIINRSGCRRSLSNMIAAILAVSQNGVIGSLGQLPWPRIDEDMAWFRKHTKDHTVVMGRKTWDSLPSKPLPHRLNYVVSKHHPDAWGKESNGMAGRLGSFGDLLEDIQELDKSPFQDTHKVFIIGGAEIFKQTWPIVDKIYLTNVHGEYEGDTSIDMGLTLSEFSLESIEPHSRCTLEIWSRDVRIP